MSEESVRNAVLRWFVRGETGVSSKAMAAAFVDLEPSRRWGPDNYPRDPADLTRCVGLYHAVPGAEQLMHKVAALGPVWAAYVAHWDELVSMLADGIAKNQYGRIYERMLELRAKAVAGAT